MWCLKEHFFKKLKNKEPGIFAKEMHVTLTSILNCCFIFNNVPTSEGACTIFDFPVIIIMELVQLPVGVSFL